MRKLGLSSDAAIGLFSPLAGAGLGVGTGLGLAAIHNKMKQNAPILDKLQNMEDHTDAAEKSRLLRGGLLGGGIGGALGLLPAVGLIAKGAARRSLMDDSTDHHDKLPGGLADKKKPSDFESSQLAKGVKVEMEHVDDKALAREIAMDHLTEDPKYYDHLQKMEDKYAESKTAGRYGVNPIHDAADYLGERGGLLGLLGDAAVGGAKAIGRGAQAVGRGAKSLMSDVVDPKKFEKKVRQQKVGHRVRRSFVVASDASIPDRG